MNRRRAVLAIVALGAAPFASVAQQPNKVWRIGMLETTAMASNGANLAAFKQGLTELGYVEGRNYLIEYRWADVARERADAVLVRTDRVIE